MTAHLSAGTVARSGISAKGRDAPAGGSSSSPTGPSAAVEADWGGGGDVCVIDYENHFKVKYEHHLEGSFPPVLQSPDVTPVSATAVTHTSPTESSFFPPGPRELYKQCTICYHSIRSAGLSPALGSVWDVSALSVRTPHGFHGVTRSPVQQASKVHPAHMFPGQLDGQTDKQRSLPAV